MTTFLKFPSIESFREAVKCVEKRSSYVGRDSGGTPIYDYRQPKPTLTFKGTVKLHGTNAGVGCNEVGDIWAQSRSRTLGPGNSDNCGFFAFVDERRSLFKEWFSALSWKLGENICIYGEWCGGNIQKGVALNDLPKMFVIFAARRANKGDKDKAEVWLSEAELKGLAKPDSGIYNIYDFPQWTIKIDFENPGASQSELERITKGVEDLCPVAAALGVSGIGEGLVWETFLEGLGVLRFKTKGEKHSSTKSNKKNSIAPIDPEKLASVNEFLEYAVTENRLKQGLEQVFQANGEEPSLKKTRDFLTWVSNDVFKEESDALQENNLSKEDVAKALSTKAREWFVAHCKALI